MGFFHRLVLLSVFHGVDCALCEEVCNLSYWTAPGTTENSDGHRACQKMSNLVSLACHIWMGGQNIVFNVFSFLLATRRAICYICTRLLFIEDQRSKRG